MNNKKYLNIIVVIIIIVLLVVGGIFFYKELTKDNKPKEEKKTITPLLYEVTKEGSSNKIYLFGSIHVAKKSDLNFPNYILNAYNNSHYLACELDSTGKEIEMQQLLLDKIMYQDETTIKDHLSEETYKKLVEFLSKRESYSNLLELYKPYFFFSLLSQFLVNDSKLSTDSGIDNYFIGKANKDNKTILEVESYEYQLDMFLSFSDLLYDIAISDTIDNYDKEVQDIIDLYNNWKDGNLEKLLTLSDEEMDIKDNYTEEEQRVIENYNMVLITNRNRTMTDKVIEYFNNNQDVFFMVGTFHIIGDDGIVNNLQSKGYTVIQVK